LHSLSIRTLIFSGREISKIVLWLVSIVLWLFFLEGRCFGCADFADEYGYPTL